MVIIPSQVSFLGTLVLGAFMGLEDCPGLRYRMSIHLIDSMVPPFGGELDNNTTLSLGAGIHSLCT